jgi:tRNA(fMet)-specific endonuclease VapC
LNVLVDSSVLIDVLRGKGGRQAILERLVAQGSVLCSCDVTLAEIWSGARETEFAATGSLLDSLYYLPCDPGSAERAGKTRGEWRRKGVTLTLADAFLAALCLHHDAVLLTDNKKHFPSKHLVVWAPEDVKSDRA